MSETPTEATETVSEETTPTTEQQPKPTETVDFWKTKAREQEKRAKDNADAAKRLAEYEDSQKSESEKVAERLAKADAEVNAVPSKVADALRSHLVALHQIDADDAELFLTANDPDLLLKQVTRLVGQKGKKSNYVPREGNNPPASGDEARDTARALFGSD